MRKSIVFIIVSFCLLIASVKAQDTSSFFKAEFVYGNNELNEMVSFLQVFPRDNDSRFSAVEKVTVPVQFIVSSEGTIESIKIQGFISIEYKWVRRDLSEEYYKWYFAEQAIALCKFSEGLWIPAEKNGVACSDTILHNFVFEWRDKNSYNRRYGFESGSDEINFFYTPLKSDPSVSISTNRFYRLLKSKPTKNTDSESVAVMYYNFALEKMNEKKYYIAERMFRLAYHKNQTNDCIFNLAVSQLNLGWVNEACINLNKINNDIEAKSLIEKYCNK